MLRKALTIVLMAAFWLPSLSPWFASASVPESRLPACCRLHGQHHCFMSDSDRATLQALGVATPEFAAPAPRCPYQLPAVRTGQQSGAAVPVAHVVQIELFTRPAGLVQTQSRWRISRERSRQKRGPPIQLLS